MVRLINKDNWLDKDGNIKLRKDELIEIKL